MEILFIGGIGTSEMLLIVFALLLLFGGKKLPELMRGMGRAIRDFKDAVGEPLEDVKNSLKDSGLPRLGCFVILAKRDALVGGEIFGYGLRHFARSGPLCTAQ